MFQESVDNADDAYPNCNNADVFAGGKGTEEQPYEICSPPQLQMMESELDAHYILTSNINLEGFAFEPIGAAAVIGEEGGGFEGTFDGNGYLIKNLRYDGVDTDSDDTPTGFFRQIERFASLYDVHLVSPVISGNNIVGGIAGIAYGTIEGATIEHGDISGRSTVAGFVGHGEGGASFYDLRGSGNIYGYADGSMIGTSHDTAVAGLLGTFQRGDGTGELVDSISNFDVYRDPEGINVHGWTSAAGAIGYTPGLALVENCHAT